MGADYRDRRSVFIGDGSVSVVDLDGNLAPGDGFEGTWRRTQRRLEARIAGDGKLHCIAWPDLARELGVTPRIWTPSSPNTG